MNTELKQRILTSIILFLATIFCVLIHPYVLYITLFVIVFICFDEWRKINSKYFKKNNKHALKLKYYSIQLFGLVYLLIFFASAIFLRGDNFKNAIFFIVILCICICSDIGGYVFGKSIGGKKLTKISPNKTISGSIGSFIFSILPLFLFNFQSNMNISFDFSLKNLILCLIISLVCQLGDLFISYFKRLNKVKNTGTILPGHGGLLDRIDGIIFAIPTVYILKILNVI